MAAVAAAVTISLEDGCGCECGTAEAFPLWDQLHNGRYDVCSVMKMPDGLYEWLEDHRTARRRYRRSQRLGYLGHPIDRGQYAQDIYEINTSLPERQGRPMSAGYLTMPSSAPDAVSDCSRHAIRSYGVTQQRKLFAYLTVYRMGELVLVSQILGHGDRLPDDIMYLLFGTMIDHEYDGGGRIVYNRHDSGQRGLRYYKEKVGLEPTEVTWEL